jgi:sortase A
MGKFGTFLIALGGLVLIWATLVWRWEDPFTALYTRYEQHQLARQYAAVTRDYRPPAPVHHAQSVASEQAVLATLARKYRLHTHAGQAIGRIVVPRLGLRMVLVDGTDHESLKRGPGRDLHTFMPGEGQTVYIAGHRTTYLAPFAHIDSLRRGDLITLQVPYGTFVYQVRTHKIVGSNDVSVLYSHNKELVILQACHPRFLATHRYLVYAVPLKVEPNGMKPFVLRKA